MMRIVAVLIAIIAYPLTAASESLPLDTVRQDLLNEAQTALEMYADDISNHDTVVLVDYSLHSAKRRLYIANLKTQSVQPLHVSHGRGSDPDHDGLLNRFNNTPGSYATPKGAHVTAEQYYGKHGKSVRMDGLEPENKSARNRAIVIHAADYAEPKMLNTHGKLGRSQGCLALSKRDLKTLIAAVPAGTLVYISK